MPHVHITNSEKDNNKGTCKALVHYLEKENYLDKTHLKPLEEREFFFSQSQDKVPAYQVIEHIDGNKKKLGKKDDKFFLVNISPSQEELKHIGNDKEKLKEYAKEVMELYAANFDKGLKSEGLVWKGGAEQGV